MAIIDFTKGCWGHRLHAESFHPKKAAKLTDRIADKIKHRRRYTVLVHSAYPISKGDSIAYMTDAGRVEAEVAHVKWMLDPKDMACIEILRTGP